MTSPALLARLEDIIDTSGPHRGSRPCSPGSATATTGRTLLLGMMLALADHRPAHLTRVHAALTTLPGPTGAGWG